MIKYKLTTQDNTTHGDTLWIPGEKRVITKPGNKLCSDQVFHGYHSPEQAVLFNPIHANIDNPRLWEVEIDAICVDDGLKFGCKEMTLLRELPLPVFTTEQRVAFAIYCAEPYGAIKRQRWAADWMSGRELAAAAASVVAVANKEAKKASASIDFQEIINRVLTKEQP